MNAPHAAPPPLSSAFRPAPPGLCSARVLLSQMPAAHGPRAFLDGFCSASFRFPARRSRVLGAVPALLEEHVARRLVVTRSSPIFSRGMRSQGNAWVTVAPIFLACVTVPGVSGCSTGVCLLLMYVRTGFARGSRRRHGLLCEDAMRPHRKPKPGPPKVSDWGAVRRRPGTRPATPMPRLGWGCARVSRRGNRRWIGDEHWPFLSPELVQCNE